MTVAVAVERAVLERVSRGLWVGGRDQEPLQGRSFAVEDPATGEELCRVADAAPADALRALDTAVAAQDQWASTAPRARGEVLRRAYDLMTERVDELALLMTLEMGKPLAESRAEVLYAAEFFRWFSEEAVRVAGRYAVSPDGQTRLLTTKRAVGPTLMITPWNFPLASCSLNGSTSGCWASTKASSPTRPHRSEA